MLAPHLRSTRTVLPADVDQALHRCLMLAGDYGRVHHRRLEDPAMREFLLELDEPHAPRLRWTLRATAGGTELVIRPSASIRQLASSARRAYGLNTAFQRLMTVLNQSVNMKIAVIGGGTGLYTTLLGLRDRSWSLTAIISGLPRAVHAREPRDQLGLLPRDDASLALVALSPTIRDNLVLRSLLTHRMERRRWRGAHFGSALLDALEETGGSRQAALDTAAVLLSARGRVAVALHGTGGDQHVVVNPAVQAVAQADMVVIAPGDLELDLMPVLCCPGISAAIRRSRAMQVVVCPIMTTEAAGPAATASGQVNALAALIGKPFDVVVANQDRLPPALLRRYAASGARPLTADLAVNGTAVEWAVVKPLSADGDLARHDPGRLAECLLELATRWLGRRAEQAS